MESWPKAWRVSTKKIRTLVVKTTQLRKDLITPSITNKLAAILQTIYTLKANKLKPIAISQTGDLFGSLDAKNKISVTAIKTVAIFL